jgi:hypothetical protein
LKEIKKDRSEWETGKKIKQILDDLKKTEDDEN